MSNNFDCSETGPVITVDCGHNTTCKLVVSRSSKGQLRLLIPVYETVTSLTVRVNNEDSYLGRGKSEIVSDVSFDDLGLTETSIEDEIKRAVLDAVDFRLTFPSTRRRW